MRTLNATVVACFCCCLSAGAQFEVSVEIENVSYVQYESIVAMISVRNVTGETKVIGGLRKGAVLDVVVTRNGKTVERVRGDQFVRNALLQSGETKEFPVNLTAIFDMRMTGAYQVEGSVIFEETRFASRKKTIDIVPGLELKTVTMPVPDDSSIVRTYSLRYWDRGQHSRLFLCVQDKKTETSRGVFDLGEMIRVVAPELSVDTDGNVKVRHQGERTSIVYSDFKSGKEGVIFIRRRVISVDKTSKDAEKGRAP